MREISIEDLLHAARLMAVHWCPSRADAEDLAQEAVIRALVQATPPRNAVTWLYVVTRRLSQRQAIRRRTRAVAEAVYLERVPSTLPCELLLDLDTILTHLGDRDRHLLYRLAEGALSAELAIEFQCGVQNIGQMVARVRRKARAIREAESYAGSGPS